jgi:hypothetical protein
VVLRAEGRRWKVVMIEEADSGSPGGSSILDNVRVLSRASSNPGFADSKGREE